MVVDDINNVETGAMGATAVTAAMTTARVETFGKRTVAMMAVMVVMLSTHHAWRVPSIRRLPSACQSQAGPSQTVTRFVSVTALLWGIHGQENNRPTIPKRAAGP